MLKSQFVKNLSWIFAGNIAHAILQFLLNVYVARAYTTDSFGLVNYASSLVVLFSSVGTLGLTAVITKFFARDEENAGTYLGTAVGARLLYSLLAIALLQVIVRVMCPNEPKLALIILCQSVSIFFGAFDLLTYWFRYKCQANTVAILRLLAFGLSAIWRIIVISLHKDIVIYVIGVTIETVFFAVFLLAAFLRQYRLYRFNFSWNKLKRMLRQSYPFVFSAILATIYGQTDKLMLKAMVDNTAVAMYSVSLTLAGAISIIPIALIEGFRPEIISLKETDDQMYQKRLRQLYALVFWICIAYCIFVSVFSKRIVLTLYGAKYLGAVSALGLVVWYTAFSYFGAINNLYMVAEEKTKWAQVTTLAGTAVNIVLNCLLIPRFGINGAACASLVTQICANFLLLYFIPDLKGNFKIIVQSIRLHDVF